MNNKLLRAIKGERVRPIWFMRQAGRYLPEYKKIREKYSLIQIIKNPELIVYITKLPVDKLKVDAAILFSDISLIFEGMNVVFDIVEKKGPIVYEPISEDDIKNLRIVDNFEFLSFISSAIKILKNELEVPLIGFSGGPFTLAVYLIEGSRSNNFNKITNFIQSYPSLTHLLLEKITLNVFKFLEFQIKSGVDLIQIFDSWAGFAPTHIFQKFILPHLHTLFSLLKPKNVPIIYFTLNSKSIISLANTLNADVISIDWSVNIKKARELIKNKAIQGNLNPAVLLSDFPTIKKETIKILNGIKEKHIFNLGHGILPQTPFDNVKMLVDFIREKEE